MSVKSKFIKKYYSELTGIASFIFYLFTLAPSVIQIDSGELAAVQSTLGIAHPTGYPLFTILGYLFFKIPLPFRIIYKANLLSAIWCATGVIFFVKSISIILENIPVNKIVSYNKKGKKQSIDKENKLLEKKKFDKEFVASLSGLFLAFTKTYWFQSTSVEVYSLQVFLFNLIIYLTLKTYFINKDNLYEWIAVGIAFSLGFSNHMTTLLVLPFTGILFFLKEEFTKNALKKLLITFCISFVILIISYSYLPIRASQNPALNWGNPINIENFLRHVSGKQYQVWLFSSFDSAKKQLIHYIQNLPGEFAYLGLIIIAAGILNLLNISKRFFYTYLVTFLFALLYVINYDIVDIDSYFILPYILLSTISSFGIKYFFEKVKNIYLSFIFGIALILTIFTINYPKVNQSDIYTFEDYTKSILNSVENNAIIFTYQWDYFISSSYYFQYVENFRKDIIVIDKELLRRSWYYNQIENNYPHVIKNLADDINKFLGELKLFESSENYNPLLLEKYYRKIMTGLVSENVKERNFYIGIELVQNELQRGEFRLPEGYQIVPHLFLFKVVKGDDYVPAPLPDFKIRFPKKSNKYIDFIENVTGTMLMYRALYEKKYGKLERAKIYLSKVKSDLKKFRVPENILRLIESE